MKEHREFFAATWRQEHMNKNESKYFKSAGKMQSALISLLEKKEF